MKWLNIKVMMFLLLQDVRPTNYFTNFVLTLLVVCYLQVKIISFKERILIDRIMFSCF
jgi:hypothetical protein